MNARISYQTLHLPPPFAFAYTLEMTFEKQKLEVDFNLEYLNRDTLSEEEIVEEGYTTNDDFQWKGSLDQVWKTYLQNELQHMRFVDPNENDPIWIHLKMEQKEGNLKGPEDWDFILQELIQAIYEQSGRELPLKVKILKQEGGKTDFYEIEGHFTNRKASLNGRMLEWKSMQTLISEIYAFEFNDQPTAQPKSDGLWVDLNNQSEYFFAAPLSDKSVARIAKLLSSSA